MPRVIGGVRAPVVAGVVSAAAEVGALSWAAVESMGPDRGDANIGLGLALLAAIPISFATGAYALHGARQLTGASRAIAIGTAATGVALATGSVGRFAINAIRLATGSES